LLLIVPQLCRSTTSNFIIALYDGRRRTKVFLSGCATELFTFAGQFAVKSAVSYRHSDNWKKVII
jgi:hypothetical protein